MRDMPFEQRLQAGIVERGEGDDPRSATRAHRPSPATTRFPSARRRGARRHRYGRCRARPSRLPRHSPDRRRARNPARSARRCRSGRHRRTAGRARDSGYAPDPRDGRADLRKAAASPCQKVVRPPDVSKVEAVVKLHSSDAMKHTIAALSLISPRRPSRDLGAHIFDLARRKLVEDRAFERRRGQPRWRSRPCRRAPCRATWSGR